MKKIPIGVDDFKKLIENNALYIDKTKFITELLDDAAEVKLFIRPRRFGKTLNMSTLKYFFDIKNASENRKLFNGLDIEKSVYISEQGKYPVIFISMKGIKTKNWEYCLYDLKGLIGDLYNEFEYIREVLNESELNTFNKIWLKEDIAEYKNALKILTTYLYKYYKKEVILLIDEYDTPLITAYKYGYYDEALPFFKVFYGEALKTNPYLKMGIMTGIIRVIKAGIFSDLNNLRVYSILNRQYSDFFGFTQSEVENALKYFSIENEIPEVKSWYDGYKFGDSDVYNPWSILNFLTDKKLIPYWIDTSDNFLINQILKSVNSDTMESLKKNKIEDFEKYLQNILLRSTSFNDIKNEDFYHGLILGMSLFLDKDYYVNSNKESGLGGYDIIIEPKNKNSRGFILEFKVVKEEEDLNKVSKEAIEQIINKKYDTQLKERGIKDITLVGIAFFKKLLKVSYKC
ncbi:AAA family ATPase [Fusobacterium polymorphum]|uniref:AAA family ATPase n=1 Tax=Fusobacterium nucleatum subsp. polymorphum TaxID=76857 RepID=UPI00300AFA49